MVVMAVLMVVPIYHTHSKINSINQNQFNIPWIYCEIVMYYHSLDDFVEHIMEAMNRFVYLEKSFFKKSI